MAIHFKGFAVDCYILIFCNFTPGTKNGFVGLQGTFLLWHNLDITRDMTVSHLIVKQKPGDVNERLRNLNYCLLIVKIRLYSSVKPRTEANIYTENLELSNLFLNLGNVLLVSLTCSI